MNRNLILGVTVAICALIVLIIAVVIGAGNNPVPNLHQVDVSVEVNPAADQGLVVSPVRKYYQAEAGDTIQDQIEIRYLDSAIAEEYIDIVVEIVDFDLDPNTCQPTILADNSKSTIIAHTSFIPTIENNLNPVVVPFQINVPDDIANSTYWFGITTQKNADDTDGIQSQLMQGFFVVVGEDRSIDCLSYDFNN